VSMLENPGGMDSEIGVAVCVAERSAPIGEAGGAFADTDVAVETSAGGGGGVAGIIVDSTGGAGGSLFDPKGHQLEACRTVFVLETGTCHCCILTFDEGVLRRCIEV
jgi:hypothetical protein